MFQQVPLNVIESNTELISYYRKKRQVEIYSADIPGITSNSVDSIESLGEAAVLALASMSDNNAHLLDSSSLSTQLNSRSYFKELAEQTAKSRQQTRSKRYAFEPTDRINSIFYQYEQLTSDHGRQNCHRFSESQRRLPGDVIYGVQNQFQSQAKLALSISHFLRYDSSV